MIFLITVAIPPRVGWPTGRLAACSEFAAVDHALQNNVKMLLILPVIGT
jgi:hypothetical protein